MIEHAIATGLYVIVNWQSYETSFVAEAEVFFSAIAQKYGHAPNVIYEPLTEAGGAQSWERDVKPYHERVIAAIRQHDPDNIIIAGTPNHSAAVNAPVGMPLESTNVVYALNFYACSQGAELRDTVIAARAAGLPLFVTQWTATESAWTPSSPLCLEEAQVWHDWLDQNAVSWTAWVLEACDEPRCLLRPGAPLFGFWTDRWVTDSGLFVRERLRD